MRPMSDWNHWGRQRDQLQKAGHICAALFINACSPADSTYCGEVARTSFPIASPVSAFYYTSYGKPDGSTKTWEGWNSMVQPHWNERVNQKPAWQNLIGKRYSPPDEVSSRFYPAGGPYSSEDPATMRRQFKQMKGAGISTAIYSWGGRDSKDPLNDKLVAQALDIAGEFGMTIALMLQTAGVLEIEEIKSNIQYLHGAYADHDSYLKIEVANERHTILDRIIIPDTERGVCIVDPKLRPVLYLYNSHQKSGDEWARLLTRSGNSTIRGTDIDTMVMAILEDQQENELGPVRDFDGMYTYYVTPDHWWNAFVNRNRWKQLTAWALQQDKVMSLTIGPGYDDSRVRPWAKDLTRDRGDGSYYDTMFGAALEACPDAISIMSFNEWNEGTQIEPASTLASAPHSDSPYLSYGESAPEDFYLTRTEHWTEKWANRDCKVLNRSHWFKSQYESEIATHLEKEDADYTAAAIKAEAAGTKTPQQTLQYIGGLKVEGAPIKPEAPPIKLEKPTRPKQKRAAKAKAKSKVTGRSEEDRDL